MKSTTLIIIRLIPVLGILVFCLGYGYASNLYPGGSQFDLQAKGFDWFHNYWCNLLNREAMNGDPNPARPWAIASMIVLCLALMIFFVQFAKAFSDSTRYGRFWQRMIQIGGVLSMLASMLIFTRYHDLMTLVASLFGVFVILGMIRGLLRSDLYWFKVSGVAGFFLLVANNYIYYSGHYLY
ncbi:MAG: hypothetical protein GYB31_07185 [Bacteroidetes bacterium]|nr:hypothetical protein [Bacteroidota bacterium]